MPIILVFILLVYCQPQGCIWPLADYQSKIVASIIAGTLKRPINLTNKISREMKKNSSRFGETIRHVLEVDYQEFRKRLLKELKRGS